MQDMPTGWSVRRREPDFKPEVTHKYGQLSLEWLEYEAVERDVNIRHQFNGTEKRLGARRLPVDGWCAEQQLVFQFHGCFFHGHECNINKGKVVNDVNGKTMRELRENTEKSSKYIKRLGYNLIEMWECEWLEMKKRNHAVRTFVQHFFPRQVNPWKKKTEQMIKDEVLQEKVFGLVDCDIRVPEHLKETFKEMQPIFKNTKVSRDDIGAHMKEYAEESGYMKRPSKMLIGSYFGEKILLATPLLKWYMEHGLEVTKIYQIVEYERKACFKTFGEAVSNARRAGDANPDQTIVADTIKLLGNSGYDKTVTNKDKHRNTNYVNSDVKASKLVNESTFRRLNPLSDDVFEVEMNKKTIKLDLPLVIGFFVYQYAKLRMLEYYFFIDRFLDRRDFAYVEMDTDSAYVALSASNFEDLIKPVKKEEFYSIWNDWFPAEACNDHQRVFVETRMNGREWTPQECCKARKRYDRRTQGLFKVEWEGDGMIALCSKTYYCFGDSEKVVCKGLTKTQNDLRKDVYMKVLTGRKAGVGTNEGFRLKDNAMYTHTQTRAALSYFYPKRVVADDGVSTGPIAI